MKRFLSLALITAMITALFSAFPVQAYEMGKIGECQTISSGWNFSHTIAIKDDGGLLTWGSNSDGQLGDNQSSRNVPKEVMNNIVSACAGWNYTAAIKNDGGLWMWGSNSHGKLGDGTTEYRHTPIKIMDDVAAVSAGQSHTAAIKKDGSLWTWGLNLRGELGNGTTIGQRFPINIINNVIAVSAGEEYTAAIKDDDSLWTWGDNTYGQLGDGTRTNRLTPVKVMDNVAAVSVGHGHTAAIKKDGTLWMWGYNFYGQLGDGTYKTKYSPIKIMDNVATVSVGNGHTAAIKKDGSLWTWGYNHYGEIGDGTTENKYSPIKIMDNVAAVSTGEYYTAAIKKDGSLWAWGYNLYGQLGDGTNVNKNTPVKIMDGVRLPNEANDRQTFDITKDSWPIINYAKCFGFNNDFYIDEDVYREVYGNSIYPILAFVNKKQSGFCVGMSITAAKHFTGELAKVEKGLNYLPFVNMETSENEYYTKLTSQDYIKEIQKYHLLQPSKTQELLDEIYRLNNIYDLEKNYIGFIGYLCDKIINEGRLMVVSLGGDLNHDVLAYNAYNTNGDWYRINVYDPDYGYYYNTQNKRMLSGLNGGYNNWNDSFLDVNRATGEIYYNRNNRVDLHIEEGQGWYTTTFYAIDSSFFKNNFEQKYTFIPKESEKNNLVLIKIFEATNFTINDKRGNNILDIKYGKLKKITPSSVFFNDSGSNSDSVSGSFVIPADDYNINLEHGSFMAASDKKLILINSDSKVTGTIDSNVSNVKLISSEYGNTNVVLENIYDENKFDAVRFNGGLESNDSIYISNNGKENYSLEKTSDNKYNITTYAEKEEATFQDNVTNRIDDIFDFFRMKYKINSITVLNGNVNVDVTKKSGPDAKLVVATYSDEKNLVDMVTRDISLINGQTKVITIPLNMAGASHVSAFIWNDLSSITPFCDKESIDIKLPFPTAIPTPTPKPTIGPEPTQTPSDFDPKPTEIPTEDFSIEIRDSNFSAAYDEIIPIYLKTKTPGQTIEGSHQYILWAAYLDNGQWKQTVAEYADGGTEYWLYQTGFEKLGIPKDQKSVTLAFALFRADNFVQGAALAGQTVTVKLK